MSMDFSIPMTFHFTFPIRRRKSEPIRISFYRQYKIGDKWLSVLLVLVSDFVPFSPSMCLYDLAE